MSDLGERFQELADAAAREGRIQGAAAAIRRARQRRLRLAGGVASLLVVLLVAGAMLVDRLAGGPDAPGTLPAVGPPSTLSVPGRGAVRTDQPRAGTPEHRLLTGMTSVLNRCRGGGAPELIGWVRGTAGWSWWRPSHPGRGRAGSARFTGSCPRMATRACRASAWSSRGCPRRRASGLRPSGAALMSRPAAGCWPTPRAMPPSRRPGCGAARRRASSAGVWAGRPRGSLPGQVLPGPLRGGVRQALDDRQGSGARPGRPGDRTVHTRSPAGRRLP